MVKGYGHPPALDSFRGHHLTTNYCTLKIFEHSLVLCSGFIDNKIIELIVTVRYHSGGSMELNACILLLAHMVYL
jgi:hypothetical protein